jgi:hypothetical protein
MYGNRRAEQSGRATSQDANSAGWGSRCERSRQPAWQNREAVGRNASRVRDVRTRKVPDSYRRVAAGGGLLPTVTSPL